MQPDPLQKLTWGELDAALYENGYDVLLTWTVDQIMDDLFTFSCEFDCDQYDRELVRPHVASWLEKNYNA